MYVCAICLSQNVVDKFLRIVFQGWDIPAAANFGGDADDDPYPGIIP